jgi:mRNA-degrading endonuclease YafQ of YafQ-DinJ toxin-antitoxin module
MATIQVEDGIKAEVDGLLVYKIFEDKLILYATDTGTHSDLF